MEKYKCKCKKPQPTTKCSENGIITYCKKCIKDYEPNTIPTNKTHIKILRK